MTVKVGDYYRRKSIRGGDYIFCVVAVTTTVARLKLLKANRRDCVYFENMRVGDKTNIFLTRLAPDNTSSPWKQLSSLEALALQS